MTGHMSAGKGREAEAVIGMTGGETETAGITIHRLPGGTSGAVGDILLTITGWEKKKS